MPQSRPTLTLEDARTLAEQCFRPDDSRDLVGIEVEWPIHRGMIDGRPTLYDLAAVHADQLPHRGRVTIEPGGQIELSTQAFESPQRAMAALQADSDVLHLRLAAAHLTPVDLAVDDRRPPRRILDKPRYAAMEAHFAQRGRAGTWMMTNTASMQVNLSHGPDGRQRWQLVNLIGPLLVAAFANSPGVGPDGQHWKSVRQAIWSCIDPGRTAPVPVSAQPEQDWADYALNADVFYIDEPYGCRMLPAGSFRNWITNGHALGWPTDADLHYHLTTLFPPVRPRRWLELRMIDALPATLRAAAVHLIHVATRDAVAETLLTTLPDTSELWDNAAREGLTHPTLRTGVRAMTNVVLEYLQSEPGQSAGADAVGAFADRFTLRDRCPADDRPDCHIDAFSTSFDQTAAHAQLC